ncbi:MAG: type I methionyl aminopeptidase [Oscillospiraceae bacterium]|jgi:methionyl aminopeptidase|nr:type I methionyl aminopeptidase [Oscillospiraceae bacterium]
MISIKNPGQLQKMRAAGALLHQVLAQVRAMIGPGVTTAQIDRLAEQLIRKHGAVPSFLHYQGYPACLCTSVDDRVVHGIPDGTPLREGQILSVDGGLILDGWHADSAFTVGIGQISQEAARLIEVTERSFFEGMAQAREGNRIGDIGNAVQSFAEAHGCSAVRALCGHGIGRALHEDPEVPNYGEAGHGVRLRAGMTVAIEPMIAAGGWAVRTLPDGWTVVTEDGSLCAHYEHTVVVTQGAPEILTLPGYEGKGATV